MAKSNDPRVTKTDLLAFYDRILPYLNGAAKSSFTPVGTVIAVMGNHAPQNFLVCDGSTYQIARYQDLADYFEDEFGSANFFGGDGTTTFAVPDLRGEFLRGTGTNSHSNQGSGEDVGVHQDGTEHLNDWTYGNNGIYFGVTSTETESPRSGSSDRHVDSVVADGNGYAGGNLGNKASLSRPVSFTSRPTNTSVLFCICTKDLFADGGGGSFDPYVDNLVYYYLKTETYSRQEVNQLIQSIAGVSFEVVQTLPTQDIQTNVIYLVPNSSQAQQNVYDEYIYLSNSWEIIGSTSIDLSNYVQKSQVVGLLKNDGTVDQNQYLTQHQDISGKADKVTGAITGNFAALDATGNLTDSGSSADDFEDADDVMSSSDMDDVFTDLPVARDNFMEYSTTERIVGKWIDGKDLYQKTIVGKTPTTSNTSVVIGNVGATIESVALITGIYYHKGGYWLPFLDYGSAAEIIYAYAFPNGDVKVYASSSGGNRLNCDCVVTIQYTKVTVGE